MRHYLPIIFVIICTHLYAQNASLQEKNQLIQDVTYLSHDSLEGREVGTKGELIAANYIAQRFESIGLLKKGVNDTSYFQLFTKKLKLHPHDTSFSGPQIEGRNVLGYLDNKSEHTVLIGAHYDHLGWGAEGSMHTGEKMVHNGADDNASGIASLLYLAEKFSKQQLNYNLLFVAFTGEEKGLLGSNYLVKNSPIPVDDINFMLNMDMVGRLDSNRRLAIYGVGTSPMFIPTIHTIDHPEFQFKLDSSGVGPSDYTSFYLENIPVLHFFTGQHAQYHRPEDDIELINFEGLYDVSLFIEQLILQLNEEQKLKFEKTRDKDQKGRKFNVTLGIIPDYLFSGVGLRIDGVKELRSAYKAGILKGDIVIQMGGIIINEMSDYVKALNQFNKGDVIEVTVIRNGELNKTKVQFD